MFYKFIISLATAIVLSFSPIAKTEETQVITEDMVTTDNAYALLLIHEDDKYIRVDSHETIDKLSRYCNDICELSSDGTMYNVYRRKAYISYSLTGVNTVKFYTTYSDNNIVLFETVYNFYVD